MQHRSAMQLSVVIPCFNEQASLEELHRRVSAAATQAVGSSYEIIFVNDGSTDASWELLDGLVARDSRCVAIDLSRRHGQQLALTAGLHTCLGERVLVMDADLQDPPEILGEMMRQMDTGADVVYGERIARRGEGFCKRLSATLFYRLINRVADVEIPVDAGEFRLMSARVVQVLNDMPEQHRFVRGMVSWAGFRQVSVRYERPPRLRGTSGYSLAKMVRLAWDAITGLSMRPLRLASLVGLVAASVGLVGALVIARDWFAGRTTSGWAGVMIVTLVLGGAQLLAIGIVGEYLGRLHFEAKRRPLYIVREVKRATVRGRRSAQGGFTYIVVLGVVAVMLITAGVAAELTSRRKQVERETELLFRGIAYRHAIESFYKANGGYPRELQDLVHDPHAAHRRHLRALYPDPMAKKGSEAGWELVQSPDGGISGVVSSSNEEPLKKAGFPKDLKSFAEAKSYRDWVFDYMPRRPGNLSLPGSTTTTTVPSSD